jgi:hypothetical protein
MAKNYVIFDNNGLLADSELKPISKGNNKVDSFYVAFTGYDYSTTYLTVAVTLPNGDSLPQLATSLSDFLFEGQNYKGFKLLVTEPITAQAGVVTMTFYVKSREDDRRLCSAQMNITIHDSDVATDPSIDNAQYENLLSTLDEDYKELNQKKLDKNFLNYQIINDLEETELVALFTRQEETKVTSIDNLHNIHEINGVAPANKKVTLTANDIYHNEKLVGDYLDDLNDEMNLKSNADETVFYRNGTLDNVLDIRPTGVLNHTTDNYFNEYYFTKIILTDTDFESGDIVTCDVSVEIDEDNSVTHSMFSFTRVLEVGDTTINHELVIPKGNGEYESVKLYGGVIGNAMGFRIISPTGIYKPTITYSIVRRG